MRFLKRLKLRTILSLTPEATGSSRDLREFCDAERVALFWFQVDKYDDGFSHTPQLVAKLLSMMIDLRNHPLYMHCRDGSHNTGLVVMCLRRLQNWSLPNIYKEFRRYTKANDITFEEAQFVQSFHEPVTIPIKIPNWLWEGIRHRTHPSIQLKLEASEPADVNVNNAFETEMVENNETDIEVSKNLEVFETKPNRRKKMRYKQIQMQYVRNVAALDLMGVHFTNCCRPDIHGEVEVCTPKFTRGTVR